MGEWTISDHLGCFCTSGGNMMVLQTIQWVSKSPESNTILGTTCNVNAVAEFELLFHEIGSITNYQPNHPMNHTESSSSMHRTPLTFAHKTRIWQSCWTLCWSSWIHAQSLTMCLCPCTTSSQSWLLTKRYLCTCPSVLRIVSMSNTYIYRRGILRRPRKLTQPYLRGRYPGSLTNYR